MRNRPLDITMLLISIVFFASLFVEQQTPLTFLFASALVSIFWWRTLWPASSSPQIIINTALYGLLVYLLYALYQGAFPLDGYLAAILIVFATFIVAVYNVKPNFRLLLIAFISLQGAFLTVNPYASSLLFVILTSLLFGLLLISSRRKKEYDFDPLTGLGKAEKLIEALRAHHASLYALCLIKLDIALLDDAQANQLFIRVSEKLRSVSEHVYRVNDDKLAVIINATDFETQLRKVVDYLDVDMRLGSEQRKVSTTLGYALYPEHGQSARAIIAAAKDALKNTSKGRIKRYQSRAYAPNSMIAKDIATGLKRGEFFLNYQPLYDLTDLSSLELRGFECLVRWQKDGQVIPPGAFISIAEETGTIIDLGRFVLENAFGQLRTWQQQGFDRVININISPQQFKEPNFVEMVIALIAEYQVNPAQVELEITESLIMHQEDVKADLIALRNAGVRLAIDDFGTGYSNLANLKDLPINTIKIDRSFIRDIIPENQAVISFIARMGEILGVDVIAEGIEDDNQEHLVSILGCDIGQGYKYAKPLDALSASALLTLSE